MNWWKKLMIRSGVVYEVRQKMEGMQDDINDNTSECAKLLYRLEESELQVKNCQARLEQLEKEG